MRRSLVQRRDLDPGDRDYWRIIGKVLSLDGKDDPVLVPRSKSLESSIEKYTGRAWIKLKRRGWQIRYQRVGQDAPSTG